MCDILSAPAFDTGLPEDADFRLLTADFSTLVVGTKCNGSSVVTCEAESHLRPPCCCHREIEQVRAKCSPLPLLVDSTQFLTYSPLTALANAINALTARSCTSSG